MWLIEIDVEYIQGIVLKWSRKLGLQQSWWVYRSEIILYTLIIIIFNIYFNWVTISEDISESSKD